MGFQGSILGRNIALMVPIDRQAIRQGAGHLRGGADMTITARITRDEILRIKVAPDILRRLEALAVRFGLPSSTLAAYAVAQWLAQQEQGSQLAEAVAKQIGGDAGDVLRRLLELVEFERKPDA